MVTADDLANVNPIRAATSISGFKHSREPILAVDKVHFVGEIIAACVERSRAEAEDIAASIRTEFEELPAVVDILEARKGRGDGSLCLVRPSQRARQTRVRNPD